MDQNNSPQSGTAATTGTGDLAERGGDGSDARKEMQEGADSVAERAEGEADTGRDPEYYGEKLDSA